MFEKLEKRIVIDYEVKAVSDLHIGVGTITAPAEIDMPVVKNSEGKPIIPGSSLKGVLRSEIERLLASKFGNEEIEDATRSKIKKAEAHTSELFGGQMIARDNKIKDFAGSIRIRDATANTPKTRIRDGVNIDIKTRKAKPGALYQIEVVPKGVVFNGQMVIENPKLGDTEYGKLGALLATINFFNMTNKSLGGGTSRGFGEVEIQVTDKREFGPADYMSGNKEGKPIPKSDEEIIKEWQDYMISISK